MSSLVLLHTNPNPTQQSDIKVTFCCTHLNDLPFAGYFRSQTEITNNRIHNTIDRFAYQDILRMENIVYKLPRLQTHSKKLTGTLTLLVRSR